ncbi:Os11g0685300 [Oryza sativa Japonica Group]|uniref:Os11g0685300 protein n=1 Tax=Oryza sativa subsp. japonica TaxID=39947 RepID=A0A0P0Y5L8_ORYSJ|nr:Os11g0685300 [Oryza sativa Japonica Group]
MQPSATPSASRRGRHVSGDHDHRDRSRCYRNAPPPCLLPPCHSSRCCRCHRGHSSRGGRRHSHSHRQTPQTPPPSPHGSRPFLHVAAPCRLTTAATSAAVTLSLGRGGGSSHLLHPAPHHHGLPLQFWLAVTMENGYYFLEVLLDERYLLLCTLGQLAAVTTH